MEMFKEKSIEKYILSIYILIILIQFSTVFWGTVNHPIKMVLFLLLLILCLWSKKWRNLYIGIPIVIGYLVILGSSGLTQLISDEKLLLLDIIILAPLSLFSLTLAYYLYQIKPWAIVSTLIFPILGVLSFLIENIRIYNQTGSSIAFFQNEIITNIIFIISIIYLVVIYLSRKNLIANSS